MKQTKSNDERSKSGHSVRVHINDDRVTSCVKMRIANNKKKKNVKKCAPRESGSCGTFANERGIATVSGRKLLGHGIPSLRRHFLCPCFVPSSEEEEDTTPSEAEAQRTKLSTSTKLSHSFISPRQLSSFRFRFRRRPLERPTTHHTSRPAAYPHTSASTLKPRHKEKDLLLCVPGAACVCACVRACVSECAFSSKVGKSELSFFTCVLQYKKDLARKEGESNGSKKGNKTNYYIKTY